MRIHYSAGSHAAGGLRRGGCAAAAGQAIVGQPGRSPAALNHAMEIHMPCCPDHILWNGISDTAIPAGPAGTGDAAA